MARTGQGGQSVRVRSRSVVSVVLAVGVVVCACQSGGTSPKPSAAHPAAASPTTSGRFGPFGARMFSVRGITLVGGDWLTVALHPSPQRVHVRVSPMIPVEVCPASLDGAIGDARSSWPTSFNFHSCEQLDPAGVATLPATDGNVHVAFGIQATGSRSLGPFDVTVSYAAEDSFVLVIPPVATPHAAVTFVPHTTTVGAQPYAMPDFGVASVYRLKVDQRHRPVTKARECDFGSEIGCVGSVTPKQPVTVTISGHSTATARLAVYVSWA